MDSDSIFYFIFMGGVVFFSFLNSMKKAKAEKEQREQAMRNQQRNQSTASPQNNTSTESKQFDEWFDQAEPDESDEPEPEPEQPITNLEDLIKALSQPKQKPQPHVAATPPQLPPQPAPQRSIAIEPPENEGQRATAITAAPDDVYSQPADRLPSSSHDWRRAVIAHEILKRKF